LLKSDFITEKIPYVEKVTPIFKKAPGGNACHAKSDLTSKRNLMIKCSSS